MAFKFALLFAFVALASACSPAPGTTTTTVTTSVTTVSADNESSGILSYSDIRIIRKIWNLIKIDGIFTPVIFFRFLSAHPEYQQKFPKFANVPQSELMTNGNFLAQSYTIMAGLNVVIQSLDNQELLDNQLISIGGAHQPRGITSDMFKEFGAVIIDAIVQEIGDDDTKTSEVIQVWKNFIQAIVDGISKNLYRPEDLADPQTKLTPYQIADVQSSWENIRPKRNAFVSKVFIRLFSESPSAQKHFAKFSGVAVDALPGNADFDAQVALVADRLDNIIATMDNKLKLLGNIGYMQYSHISRNISDETYDDFGRIFLESLVNIGVSADVISSWKCALVTFIVIDGHC